MIPDKLLINLKILGKIQKNGRLCRSLDGIMSLETGSYLQGLRRALTGDSRKQTLFEITNIVNEVSVMLNTITNSKFMTKEMSYTEEFYKTLEEFKMLITETVESEIGITNLRFTYISDVNTTAQLDVILLRLSTSLKDAKQKCTYFDGLLLGQ